MSARKKPARPAKRKPLVRGRSSATAATGSGQGRIKEGEEECRHLEEALREAEERHRAMVDLVPAFLWQSDAQGHAIMQITRWGEYTGQTLEQTQDWGWLAAIHPEDQPRTRRSFEQAFRDGTRLEIEQRIRRHDGEYRWFLVRQVPSKNPQGEVTQWYGVITDIEDFRRSKEAETASATTAERLRLALETSRSGEWERNFQTGEVWWSPEHNAIFDFPLEQRKGQHKEWLTRVHPDDRAKIEHTVQAALTEGTNYQYEFRVVRRDGSVRWVASSGRAMYDAQGKPLRMIGVVSDITARKEAEAALRENEQRFRLANLHAPYPIMLHTDAGEIVQINDAWTHLTGYHAEELATMEDWIRRAHPGVDVQAELRRQREAVSEHLGVYHCKGYRLRCADGRERLWDVSSAALGTQRDGQMLRITTAVDVTEQHAAEVALRAAKEEAERANQAKSEFLSRMSHELRTPLNAILGFGQVLEISALDEQDTQCVGHILKGGHLLLSLVDEVLDLARVEAGQLDLQLEPLALGAFARECVGFVGKLAAASQVTCTFKDAPAAHTKVLADERRLRQVLLNLLSNAIKYNHRGGKVMLSCAARSGGRVRLSVADTGPGISPEGLARLFVPFERLGQELGPVEGTGLGLVVSRQLMEAMGGSLGVESHLERGSTFWVELPLPAGAADPPATLPAVPADLPRQRQRAEPVTLLYIEDNLSNQQVLHTVVARLRPAWRYLAAADGVKGLEQARQHCPSLILLDLQLPGMKGDAVLSELRASPETREIPVLMLSADATAHSRERLLALGANDYLSKPFNVISLLEKIEAMLATLK